MAHTRTADPQLRVPIAVYLRCHPYDRWRMEPHHHALLHYADRMSLSPPDVFFDNGCRSKGPLPQLDRLLRAVDSGCYQVLLVPGPFVLSLDDRKAQDLVRWIRSRGCRVEELPALPPATRNVAGPTMEGPAPGRSWTAGGRARATASSLNRR